MPLLLILCTAIMFGLKLGGVIALSWWIVFSPVWVPLALWLFVMAIVATIGVIVTTRR